MSSNPRAERRIRSPRAWSLRARLLATQIVLLAVVCAVIGLGAVLALQHFLTSQLDDRLAETARRSAGIFAFGPPPPPPGLPGPPRELRQRIIIRDEMGPGPAFLNAPGQAARTVGAVVRRGTPVNAGIITADGTRSQISSTAAQQLAHIEPHEAPTTV